LVNHRNKNKYLLKKTDNTNVQKEVIWQMIGQNFDELGTDATNL
jgi:hypothetical protein